MAFSTSRLARVASLLLLVARKVSRTLEMLPNISNTDEAPLGIALGFELIDGNPLGIREGTPDTEGASLGIALGFELIDGNSLGDREGTPDTEGAPLGIALGFELIDGNPLGDREGTSDTEGAPDTEGASLGWGRCVW